MFKTGIYTLEQLEESKNLKTILGKERKISITLYSDLVADVHKNHIAEKILLNFTDERGAFKRTYNNRFEAFDEQAMKEIQKQFSQDDDLVFHDVAISDGRTAFDFFEKLNVKFPKVQYYASDYDPYIFVIESGQRRLVLNSEGIPLEVTYPPFVINLIKESIRYPINRLVRFYLKHTLIKKMISDYKRGLLKADKRLIACSKAIMLATKDARFHLMQHNLLKPSPFSQSVNVVRAMNILNPGYFTLDEFRIVIGHIFNALSDNGLFLMGSNQDSNSTVNGGIFIKKKDGFQKLWQSGEKSFIEDIILQHRHPS